MLAVVRVGRIGLDLADGLVPLVDVDRQLVTEVALAVLLGPGGVEVLLAALGRHRTLLDQFPLASAVVLLRFRHQGRVDDLTAACDETLLEQLRRDTLEQRHRPRLADPVLEGPHRGAAQQGGRVRQAIEALVAHAVQQLVFHLLIGQVVQALQHQDSHHRLGRVRRTSSLRAHRARHHPINLGRQRHKVDVRLDLDQRIAQRVGLLAVVFVSEQVGLDGAKRFHRYKLQQDSGRCNFTKDRRVEVF